MKVVISRDSEEEYFFSVPPPFLSPGMDSEDLFT
jgi:hypothetical protein